MPLRSLTHLSDAELDRDIKLVHRREQNALGEGLSHIAEFDTRKRYLSAGYESMYLYCLAELYLSENQTLKRLQVVRAGRKCPALFDAIADGHLHLTGAGLLAPHLTAENGAEWLRLAKHRTKREIEALLAAHFRQPELPACEPEPERASPAVEHAPAHVREVAPVEAEVQQDETQHAPAHVEPPAVRLTLRGRSLDLFRRAQALLGDEVRSDHPDDIERKVLELAVAALEKRTLVIARRAKPSRGAPKGRHIPKAIRREVWERDGGQCTFTSEAGVRCTARSGLQFDHIVPVARGGETTAANLRMLCRAHNQHEAERVFGAGFMAEKREAAKLAADQAAKLAADRSHCDEVIPWLEAAGYRKADARRGAARCIEMAGATLEARVLHAMKSLGRERFGHLTQLPSPAVT